MRVMTTSELYWESSYEIVLALMETYPDVDLEVLTLSDLNQRVIELPGFADDPAWANDAILNGILRDWYEEINA